MLLELVKKNPLRLSWIPGLLLAGAFVFGTLLNLSFDGMKGFVFGINVWQNFFSYLIAFLFIGCFEWILCGRYRNLLYFTILFVIAFSITYYFQYVFVDNNLVFTMAEICFSPWILIMLIRSVVLNRFYKIFNAIVIILFFVFINIVFQWWTFSVLIKYRSYLYLIDLLISPGLFYLLINISDCILSEEGSKNIIMYRLFSKENKIKSGEFTFRAILYVYIFLIALDNVFGFNFIPFSRIDNKIDLYVRCIISCIITIVFAGLIYNLFLMRFNSIKDFNDQIDKNEL